MVRVRTFSRILTLSATILVLSIANVTAVMPFVLSSNANAVAASEVVYDALPSVSPDTNYPSLGFQATSTSEFGDYIHLGGSNRKLNTVTVTMSNWAKYADYNSNPVYNSSGWSHPITLNVYKSHLGSDGAPDALLATTTQTASIPWRPAEDPSCGLTTSNGYGWKVGGTCFDYNGIAFNVTFDLSGLSVALPDDIIVGVAYDTQSYRNPIGASGPYNSLNVAIPDNQPFTVGYDDSAANVFWKNTYLGGANVFSQDTGWTPNGTVALRITATSTALDVPVHASPANGAVINYNDFWFDWSDVNGAVSYELQNSTSSAVDGNGSFQNVMWTGDYQSIQPTESKSRSVGASGTWYWQVRAVDSAGNNSPWSSPWEITIDKTAPAAPTLNSPINGAIVNGASVTQGWSASSSSDVDHYVYESYFDAGANNLRWSENFAGLSKTAANVANTTFWWRVKAVDAAGNVSAWSPLWKLTIDNDVPVVSIDSPTGNLFGGNAEVRGTVTDANLHHYWIQVKRNNLVVYENTVSSTGISNALLYTATVDGEYKVTLAARDGAGNRSGDVVNTFTVDKTAPAVPTNLGWTTSGGASIANSGITNDENGVASWSASASSDTTYYMYKYWNDIPGNPYKEVSPWVNSSVSGTSLPGAFNQGEGVHYFSVAVVDGVGNVSAFSAPFIITFDKTAPTVTINPIVASTDTTPTVTGTTDELGGDVAIILNSAVVATVTSDASGSWSWTSTTPLAIGSHTVVATATDAAGNPSSSDTSTPQNYWKQFAIQSPAAVEGATTTNTIATTTPSNNTSTTTGDDTLVDLTVAEVLGDQDSQTADNKQEVAGANTEKNIAQVDTDTDSNGSVFGLAWYWWLAILAALTALWWAIAAYRRHEDEA